MTQHPLQNHKHAPTLFTLFLTILITACNPENIADIIIDKPASNTSYTATNTAINTTSTNISLAWNAPSERENNTPISLSEIAGYKLYYGIETRSYLGSIDINDGTANSYTFNDFSTGTYYFALTTYDTAGRESPYSIEIKKVV